jgi:hypothetical protein
MPEKTRRLLFPLGLAVLVLANGCGKSLSQNEQVEGTVKMDGVPLANVAVQFMPDDPKTQGPSSYGVTDDKGHFTLACENKKPGAVIGKHNVVVLAGRNDTGDTTPRPNIPGDYNIASTTPLKIEVTAAEHTYNLDLSRNPPKRK